jgi:endonuclease/exonuclease/phosphatase (EEP) superfamily protein YafD
MPVLLMGDLNCTPFSPWFPRLLERGALRDSAIGYGLTGTWTGQGVRLPIDHILVNERLRVLDYREEAEWHGSDHRPVRATLALQVSH